MKNNNFICPICNSKISWKELLVFNRNHITECQHCKTKLTPDNKKSFQWGFAFGFLGAVLPMKIYLYYFDNFINAFLFGILGAVISFAIIFIYIYKTTIREHCIFSLIKF